jgi:hypothetical protein
MLTVVRPLEVLSSERNEFLEVADIFQKKSGDVRCGRVGSEPITAKI